MPPPISFSTSELIARLTNPNDRETGLASKLLSQLSARMANLIRELTGRIRVARHPAALSRTVAA